MMSLGAIVCGFLLDLAIGDPHGWPHPIILIGNLISTLEKKVRAVSGTDPGKLLRGGFVLVLIVCVLSFFIPFLILYGAGMIDPWLRFILETIMCYQIFCTRSLRDESMKVYDALEAHDLPLGRKMLSWIVGRDTAELSEEEVVKGAVETIAENTADGILAPMLYMFIGGAPLAFLYKGINTMDSMIGYRDEKFLYIGRYAAKLDDIANFVPARVCAFCMMAASFFIGLDTKSAWKIFWRDRYHHLSPNSAQTESVAAGALHLMLGGDHYYFGKLVHKETIGDDIQKAAPVHIKQMNLLMYFTSITGLLMFSLFRTTYLLIAG
ncbi:MAG: cobalamin biosynthesis protein CobD [Acidaminococcaceae bacterium]|nr:cobalamin biosynthesis protein CobD [Acidaminococcaceae bacterium]MBQ8491751.1 cobalamin biosynthesis protein CobD [Acidaminococcaceae bacterium]MBQ9257306.1 cobalamin biosynthesis protein CobD [Acidaminococcaceae bacterium]